MKKLILVTALILNVNTSQANVIDDAFEAGKKVAGKIGLASKRFDAEALAKKINDVTTKMRERPLDKRKPMQIESVELAESKIGQSIVSAKLESRTGYSKQIKNYVLIVVDSNDPVIVKNVEQLAGQDLMSYTGTGVRYLSKEIPEGEHGYEAVRPFIERLTARIQSNTLGVDAGNIKTMAPRNLPRTDK